MDCKHRRSERLLAETGEPVCVTHLATAGGWPVEEVQAELDGQPGVDWADDSRDTGFGLALQPTRTGSYSMTGRCTGSAPPMSWNFP